MLNAKGVCPIHYQSEDLRQSLCTEKAFDMLHIVDLQVESQGLRSIIETLGT